MDRRSFLANASLFCLTASCGAFSELQSQSGLRRRIKAQLDLGVADERTIGAVVMVARKGKVEVLDAAGYANRESQKLMPTDAIFDIRSISKPITVLGALLLVQDGKLWLDTPLSTVLPEFSRCKVVGQDQPTMVPITMR